MQQVIDRFKELVAINGPSYNEKKVADDLVEELKNLNFEVIVDNSGEGKGDTGNVIGKRKGTGEVILLAAHMDTVEPTEGIVIKDENGRIYTDGNTILGADDRAGITAILEGIKMADEKGTETRPLEVVFTIAEEAGLNGAKGLDISNLESKKGFVLDSGGDVGTIIYKAPSEIDFIVQIHGKAAHSGVNPEDGVNAIKIAAHAIAELPSGRIDEETTANFGIIQGGEVTNIVCPFVEIKGEIRSHNFEKAEKLHHEYQETFKGIAKRLGGKIDWNHEVIFRNFEIKEDTDLVKLLKNKFEKLGVKMQMKPRGGGSDANILNEKGIYTVNLGVGMEKGHTKDEYITHENLINSSLLVELLVQSEDEND